MYHQAPPLSVRRAASSQRRLPARYLWSLSLALTALLSSAAAHAEDFPSWDGADEASDEPTPAEPSESPSPSMASNSSFSISAGLDAQLAGADADLARVGAQLKQTQRETRMYFASWFIGHAGLSSMSAVIASHTDDKAMKGAFAINSVLAGGMFVHLLIQGWPALGSYKRFEKMPDSTIGEKVAKTTYAQNVIAAQINKDRMTNEIDRHIAVMVGAVGFGLGVGFGFDSLLQGLTIGIGVLTIGELAILTRPNIYHGPVEHPGKTVMKTLSIAPMADRYARGVGLSARF